MPAADDHLWVRQLVRRTPGYQVTLQELCTCPGRGTELLAHNPALACIVAHSVRLRPQGERLEALRQLASLPCRDLLTALGLPARPRTLRLIRKVPREHCRPRTIEALRGILVNTSHRWVHVLPHLSRVTRDTVSLFRLDPSLVTPGLLVSSSESDWDVETVTWLLVSIRTMLIELDREGRWPYSQLNLDQLKLVEGKLLAQLAPDYLGFPVPPFPGRQGEIEPIRDLFDLAREAELQRNCVLILLLQDVLGAQAYVYAVRRPERVTVALRRPTPLGEWFIAEIRGFANAEPAPETVAWVYAWLLAAKADLFPGN